jgi:hypothetical protein
MFDKSLLSAILFTAVLSGCGQNATPSSPRPAPPVAKEKDSDEHGHGAGPNGGVVFDFGRHHAEFTVDHDKKTCMVVVLGSDLKTPVAVSAKGMMLTTKPSKTKDGKNVPTMTITLVAKDQKDGKSATYVGTDPGLTNVADFEGTIAGEVDGKPIIGEFIEE